MLATQRQSSFKQFELDGWQRSVDAYDTSFTPLTNKAGDRLLSALQISRDMNVLDIACGPGHLTKAIHETGAHVVGADFSPNMIERARHSYPGVSFEVQDAENLSYPANSFDVVAMNFGVLHLDSPELAAAEAARVLKPDGKFGFTVWAPPSEARGFALVLKAVEELGDPDVRLPVGPPFFKYSDPAAGKALLTEAGLWPVVVERVPFIWSLRSPEEFFQAFHLGTARTGGLLRAQPAERLEKIKSAVEAAVREQFGSEGSSRIDIPMPAMIYVGSARRA